MHSLTKLILEFNIIVPTGKGNAIERKNILSKSIASDCRDTCILIRIKEDELILWKIAL